MGAAQRILIDFRHGLGDAVQLGVVLRHLRRLRPKWEVDVALLPSKHPAVAADCRRTLACEGTSPEGTEYDAVYRLDWPECVACYADSPSTKAERCLREVFQIEPLPELCRYELPRCASAAQAAARYCEQVCGVRPGADGRYPVVLLHYQGNTSPQQKDLSHELAGYWCNAIESLGCVPVILDWDRRSPWPDGRRIFCPDVHCELWGGQGTGDALALAELIRAARLMIGIDSGPLHVAGATDTPTLGVWTGHHPLHYFGLADNVTHFVPVGHHRLLRGDRKLGLRYFQQHYRHVTYENLAECVSQAIRAQATGGGLAQKRGFWIRTDNAEQDLVIVNDIYERDAYRVSELPWPRPVVVDVGAHVGCFSKLVHDRYPLARIVAVECCPENLPALRANVGEFAEIVPAALTYEREVALKNAVRPHCVSTGGSCVVPRQHLEEEVGSGALQTSLEQPSGSEYWADFRPLRTLTLEELFADFGWEQIDLLKLDCEGSELSLLEHATCLDRVRLIVGEYHDRARFLELVQRRLSGWELRLFGETDPGTFWLANPQEGKQCVSPDLLQGNVPRPPR